MFVCPLCDHASLNINCGIELPPELGSGDELTLQVVSCSWCSFRGAAIYEESRQGSISSESCHHYCFAAPADALTNLQRLIESCPQRRKRRCRCSAHLTIGCRDESGRWMPPLPITGSKQFQMKQES